MSRILTVLTADGAEHDVEVTALGTVTMRLLSAALGRAWIVKAPTTPITRYPDRNGAHLPEIYSGATALPPDMTLAESPLRDGGWVGFGVPAPVLPGRAADPAGAAAGGTDDAAAANDDDDDDDDFTVVYDEDDEDGALVFRIVAGHGAGAEQAVPAGQNGRVDLFTGDLAKGDRLNVEPYGGSVLARGFAKGRATERGRPVTTPHLWDRGVHLVVGRSCVRWEVPDTAEPERLPAGEDGTLLLDPPARRAPRQVAAELPAPAVAPDPGRDRWWHSPTTRRARTVKEALDARAWLVLRAAAGIPVEWPATRGRTPDDLVTYALARFRETYLEAAELAAATAAYPSRLWTRCHADADFLALRLGLRLAVPRARSASPAAPSQGAGRAGGDVVALDKGALPAVTVLPREGVIGVSGAGDEPRRLAGWLALQAAAHHSPEDVAVRVFTDAAGAGFWRWARWLPRSSSTLDEERAPQVVADPTSVARQVQDLLMLIESRRSAAAVQPPAERRPAGEAGRDLAGVDPDGQPAASEADGEPAGSGTDLLAAHTALLARDLRSGIHRDDLGDQLRVLLEAASTQGTAAVHDLMRRLNSPEGLAGLRVPPVALRLPVVVVVLDGSRRLRVLPGVSRLLTDGPAFGVYTICLDDEARQLPDGCGLVVDLDAGEGAGARITRGSRPSYSALPDLPLPRWFDTTARTLAPLRDIETVRRAKDLTELPLSELLGLQAPDDPGPIAARWAAVPRSTTAVVGQAAAAPFALDLRRHGPHALVAGTSGSGIVTFLRTWVVSLAVANRPDEMVFVLVDYKGGAAAFGPAADLPHVTNLVTDLDEREVDRVLGRLGAELRAREAQLAAHDAKDIDDYHLVRDRRRELPPLPRLVIVVAEFANLGLELPGLLTGLLDVAQRGRALGVHLVLATQRPSGALSGRVRAATNLRIALRLGTTGESTDIIDAPDAATIRRSSPGRAFVRSGAEELNEFQAAGPVAPRTLGGSVPLVAIRQLDRTPAEAELRTDAAADTSGPTDLDLLVAAVRAATESAGVPVLPGPLPEPLPAVIALSELPAPREPDAAVRDLAPVAYGVEELADEVGRQPALFDLAGEGALAATGGPRSGKSQLLRTLAAALATRHGTADVHLFGVDCGNGALQVLSRLPHCGTVVTRGRADHLARLVSRLTAALYTRQQLLAEGGFSDIASQRHAAPQARRLPYLVLLLDRWEGLRELAERTDAGRLLDDVRRLIRDGAAAGIRVVLTADAAGLDDDTAALVTEHLVLDRRDGPAGYRALGVDPPRGHLGPGRALRAFSPVELQIALLDGEPTARAQSDAVDRLAGRLRERDAQVPHARRPFTIDDAPRAAEQFHVGPGMGRPVGREDVLAWLRDRLSTGASAALLGPRRAGKTWVLEELSRRLASDGGRREVHRLTVPAPSAPVESPDALARILDRSVRDSAAPAEALLDKATAGNSGARLVFLLDEVGRLAEYDPAAVSWLRDLGQSGAWLLYTGTEHDWRTVVRRALTAPGSSFGNDVNAQLLGPLDEDAALDFLTGTAANLGVAVDRDTTAAAIVRTVGSWPFYLQVAGDAVVRAVQGNDLSPLTGEEALRALLERRLLDEWSLHFQSRWAEIGPAGRAALLAEPGATPRGASPAQRQDLRDVGLLRPGEKWLDDRPLLAWIARNEISLRDGELPR